MNEEEIKDFLKGLKEDSITVKKIKFPELKHSTNASRIKVSLKHLFDVKVIITAQLGQTTLKGSEILAFKKGKLIILNKIVGEQIDLYINNQKFAKGEVLVIGEVFAIRVSSIYPDPNKDSEEL
ncbi:MAG: FliM/FliN family flagellar motor switch protein [Eubacteriales bacterium]|jgi:flagellar motor switch protein FliN/FliY